VQAMDGQIGIVSAPDQGSTFWFEIPIRAQAGIAPGPSRSLDLRGLRVLVVDDNATNRVVLDSQLREWHLVPTSVASGEEALAALRDQRHLDRPYEVAILDMAMPTMDGVELAQRVSADRSIPGLHLILLSSGLDVDPEVARAAGVSAWLTKPVRRSQLFDSLAQVLAKPEPSPATAPDVPPSARGRLLLAEDNDINALVAVGILGSLGFETDVAQNGAEALDRLSGNDYDGVLMDCQMPVMDGYTATTELRRRETDRRHTPVIALTASARWEDRDRCLAAGMDDFVSKPVDQHSLAQTLDRWIPPASPRPSPSAGGAGQEVADAVAGRLAQLRGSDDGGAPLVRLLIEAFLDHTPGELDDLADSLTRQDFPAVATRAHRLKGSATNLGADRLTDCLAEIEDVGRSGRGADPGDLLRRLRAEFETVTAMLRQQNAGGG
jgi:two-component system, sensor histidine kinase and response regulator